MPVIVRDAGRLCALGPLVAWVGITLGHGVLVVKAPRHGRDAVWAAGAAMDEPKLEWTSAELGRALGHRKMAPSGPQQDEVIA